ncbi:MAG: hypothetical protein PHQ29_07305, partial [Candidatus Cloacimonetes bacterium]|nr:hypothetical protein [Candidatus Cloacimonadota bacterium]
MHSCQAEMRKGNNDAKKPQRIIRYHQRPGNHKRRCRAHREYRTIKRYGPDSLVSKIHRLRSL